MNGLSLLWSHVDVTEVLRLHQLLENVLSLLLELVVDEVLNGFSWNTLLLLVGLLVALGGWLLHLLIHLHLSGLCGGERADLGGRSGSLDGENDLAVAAASKGESQLDVVVVLNDDPVVTVMVTEIDLLRVNLVLGSEIFGGREQGLEVRGHDTLDYRGLALSCKVEGQFDVQVLIISFNHSCGYFFG